MKKQLFIDYFRKEVRIIPNTAHIRNSVDWHINDLQKLKAFMQHINFNCDIIKPEGGCKQDKYGKHCCCTGCYSSRGYFKIMLSEDTTYYARHFQKTIGFWREGKGCILPHKRRSIICLVTHCNYHYCHSYKANKHFGFSRGISLLKEKMEQDREAILSVLNY